MGVSSNVRNSKTSVVGISGFVVLLSTGVSAVGFGDVLVTSVLCVDAVEEEEEEADEDDEEEEEEEGEGETEMQVGSAESGELERSKS